MWIQGVKFKMRPGGCIRINWMKMRLEERHRGQTRDDVKIRGKKGCCLGDGQLRHYFPPGCS